MFSPEERKRAVEPYFTTSMMTAEVAERLGYPTRQRLEHWPVADSRYAERMRKPAIPLRTRRKAIELVLGETCSRGKPPDSLARVSTR